MSKKTISIVAFILLICFIFVFAISFLTPYIASAAPTQADIQNAQDKVNQANAKKKEAENKKKSVLEQKNEIESQIDTIQAKLDECSAELEAKNLELTEAEEKEKKQYETMKLRLRTMYEDNSASYIELIFNGESLTDAINSYELIKQLLTYDNNMYENLEKTRKEIEEVKNQIEENKNTIESQKSELDSKNAELAQTVKKLNDDISSSQKEKEAAEREMQRLKQQYAAAVSGNAPAAGGAYYSGGKLQWPTPSCTYITSYYGYRLHPVLKVWKGHTGIDIGAGYGADVLAAEDGTVTVAGTNVAYGKYIIINHGGGLATLYAHNSSLLVSSGQNVKRGQVIAKVGSTGYSTGPHCHFEVMVNGATVDPLPYVQ